MGVCQSQKRKGKQPNQEVLQSIQIDQNLVSSRNYGTQQKYENSGDKLLTSKSQENPRLEKSEISNIPSRSVDQQRDPNQSSSRGPTSRIVGSKNPPQRQISSINLTVLKQTSLDGLNEQEISVEMTPKHFDMKSSRNQSPGEMSMSQSRRLKQNDEISRSPGIESSPSSSRGKRGATVRGKSKFKPDEPQLITVKLEVSNLMGYNPCKIARSYTQVEQIAQGSKTQVLKYQNNDTLQFKAVRCLKKTNHDDIITNLFNEQNIVSRLDHPNILRNIDFFQDEKFYYGVQEMCMNGTLMQNKSHNEHHIAGIMLQLLSVLNYIHGRKIANLNICLKKILLTGSEQLSIRIGCFEFAKTFGQKCQITSQPAQFIAPEAREDEFIANDKIDIYAAGTCLYYLLCGDYPVKVTDKKKDQKPIYHLVMHQGKSWSNLSEDAKTLLEEMLHPNPSFQISQQIRTQTYCLRMFIESMGQIIKKNTLKVAIKELKFYQKANWIQKAVLFYIFKHLITQEQKDECLKIFYMIDTDHQGQITQTELETFLRKYDNEFNEDEQNGIFRAVDINQNGLIEFSELTIAIIKKKTIITKQNLKKIYAIFNRGSNNEALHGSQLFKQLESMNIDHSVWEKTMKLIDDNGDDKISRKEFINQLFPLINDLYE